MTPTKRKVSTFMIDVDLPNEMQKLQVKLNSKRTANEGALSLSDLVNMAIKNLIKQTK